MYYKRKLDSLGFCVITRISCFFLNYKCFLLPMTVAFVRDGESSVYVRAPTGSQEHGTSGPAPTGPAGDGCQHGRKNWYV